MTRMRRLALIGLPMASAALIWLGYGKPKDEGTRLVVDLSARTLTVYDNGSVEQSYGVAIGRPSHPTPTGSYRTGDIVWNPDWRPPPVDWAKNRHYEEPGAATNPMQAVKIYFKAPYYFIHGTNSPNSIGEAASHGCIRMTPEDARALAHTIEEAGGSVPLLIKD